MVNAGAQFRSGTRGYRASMGGNRTDVKTRSDELQIHNEEIEVTMGK